VLLPLQNVRGNFARIHSVLSELLSMSERLSTDTDIAKSVGGGARQVDLSSVQLAVQDAITMFQRQAQSWLQVCQQSPERGQSPSALNFSLSENVA